MVNARLLGRVGALAAVCAGAAFAASAPAASAETVNCSIWGSGSSLQFNAQTLAWAPNFTSCEAGTAITYTATSSGTGEAEWGSEGALNTAKEGVAGHFDAFIGTDVGPEGSPSATGTQIANMVTAGKLANGEENPILTVPVAQSAIAIIVSLPENCLVSGTQEVTASKLEQEWAHNNLDWHELLKPAPTGTGCSEIPTLVARGKASGTTAGFKRGLEAINESDWSADVETAPIAESTNHWPVTPFLSEAETGSGGQLAEYVLAHKNTIGYADLSDAAAKGFSGTPEPHGHSYDSAWVSPENNSKTGEPAEFESPENGTESNCSLALYNTPSGAEPVALNVDWSGAKQNNAQDQGEGVYPFCTLTFDVAWHHYGTASTLGEMYGATEGARGAVAETVLEYLRFIVGTGQSTKLTEEHYGTLPPAVDSDAKTALVSGSIIGL